MRLNSHVLRRLNSRYYRRQLGGYQVLLRPEQISAGTKTIRTYKDWVNLFKNPEVSGKLGVSHFFTEKEQNTIQ
ncbi:MAG: hypothetical protein PUP92_15290 [Rhizonema sp. PD38]|nr:hypothetical protein [Rhizonema sp. PD38]